MQITFNTIVPQLQLLPRGPVTKWYQGNGVIMPPYFFKAVFKLWHSIHLLVALLVRFCDLLTVCAIRIAEPASCVTKEWQSHIHNPSSCRHPQDLSKHGLLRALWSKDEHTEAQLKHTAINWKPFEIKLQKINHLKLERTLNVAAVTIYIIIKPFSTQFIKMAMRYMRFTT